MMDVAVKSDIWQRPAAYSSTSLLIGKAAPRVERSSLRHERYWYGVCFLYMDAFTLWALQQLTLFMW